MRADPSKVNPLSSFVLDKVKVGARGVNEDKRGTKGMRGHGLETSVAVEPTSDSIS